MTWVPSKDSDQPGHSPSLIRVFAVHMKKHWAFNYLLSTSEDYDQTERMPRLIGVLTGCTCHFAGFVMRQLKYEWLIQSARIEDSTRSKWVNFISSTVKPISTSSFSISKKISFHKLIALVITSCQLRYIVKWGKKLKKFLSFFCMNSSCFNHYKIQTWVLPYNFCVFPVCVGYGETVRSLRPPITQMWETICNQSGLRRVSIQTFWMETPSKASIPLKQPFFWPKTYFQLTYISGNPNSIFKLSNTIWLKVHHFRQKDVNKQCNYLCGFRDPGQKKKNDWLLSTFLITFKFGTK